MLDQIRQGMKYAVGMTDEDFEVFASYPQNVAFVARMQEMMKYKIFAEVVESTYCGAKLQPGQKFTLSCVPMVLIPEESSCALCARAIGPIANAVADFWGQIIQGEEPSERIVECLDPGYANGGLGHVRLKVRAEKVG